MKVTTVSNERTEILCHEAVREDSVCHGKTKSGIRIVQIISCVNADWAYYYTALGEIIWHQSYHPRTERR